MLETDRIFRRNPQIKHQVWFACDHCNTCGMPRDQIETDTNGCIEPKVWKTVKQNKNPRRR